MINISYRTYIKKARRFGEGREKIILECKKEWLPVTGRSGRDKAAE
ncbi:MAG: hypothetical protein J6J42_07865 [Lachnospiraceae bacterium]|nr:hypothetical protein [Lachnospiraceae bacterium]